MSAVNFLALAIILSTQQGDRNIVVANSGPLKGRSIYTNSHALLVGIDTYRFQRPLQYAVRDAEFVQRVLVERYGFPQKNVKILKNQQASKDSILKALGALGDRKRVGRDDRVLVYFACHGATAKAATGGDAGFLVPWDDNTAMSNLGTRRSFETHCVAMRQVWEILKKSPAKHVLVVADVCCSGFLSSLSRDSAPVIEDATLAEYIRWPARQGIAAGTKLDSAVERSELGHGLFTYHLFTELEDRWSKGMPFAIGEVFSKVKASVVRESKNRQTPQFGFDEDAAKGEFLFIPTQLRTFRTAYVPGTVPVDVNENDWAYVPLKYIAARLTLPVDPGGKFSGKAPATRYDVADGIYGLVKASYGKRESLSPGEQDTFPDIAELEPRWEALRFLKRAGIILGYPDGLFRGNRPATRNEFAEYLCAGLVYRLGVLAAEYGAAGDAETAARLNLPSGPAPRDVPVESHLFDPISKLTAAGIISTYADGDFRGNRPMSRYEVYTAIYKAMRYIDLRLPQPPR